MAKLKQNKQNNIGTKEESPEGRKLEKGFYGFWVRKRRFTFLLTGLIIAAGMFSLYIIPKESSPDIEFGLISINTVYRGVNPQDIDNLITEKIETAVKDIDGLKKMTSTSSIGVSTTQLELENGTDITKAIVDTKDAVDKVDLPSEAETPIVTEISTDNELMFIVLLYADADRYGQIYLNDRARKIKDNLDGKGSINRVDIAASTKGSKKISMGGAGESSYDIQVLLDKDKVEAMHINLFLVSQSIKSWNQNQPLGNHQISDLSYDFRVDGELKRISELGMIPIQTQGGFVYLKDIATVKKKLKDDSIKRLGAYQLSGQNYISLSINKSAGENLFESAQEAKRLLDEELQKTEYLGLHYKFMSDMSELITDDYSKLAKNGLQTLILVFLALLLFVGLKESIIATITLPLAFFITFMVLKQLGLSLNFLTNFSLIITFGIAIDTTIVVIEGAHERLRQGFRPKHAILLSVRDYKLPLIAGTTTTVVVFLPLITLPGVMGKFLAFIPITIFSTLVAALLISLTINSALYYKLSKPEKHFEDKLVDWKHMAKDDQKLLLEDRVGMTEKPEEHGGIREKILDKIAGKYAMLIEKVMESAKTRLLYMAIAVGMFIVSMVVVAPSLGFNIFPASDNSVMNIYVTAKKGSNKEYLDKYSSQIDETLSNIPEIKVYDYTIQDNLLSVDIELIKQSERKKKKMRSIFEVEKELEEKLSNIRSDGLKLEIEVLKDGPPGAKAIGIKLIADTNEDFDKLLVVAKDFEDYINTLPGSKNASISSQESPGQFVYKINKEKISVLGVTPGDFLFELYAISNGIDAGALKGKYDDHDIKVQYSEFEDKITPNRFNDLNLQTKVGQLRVGDITDYYLEQSISQITREDGKIMLTISANTKEDVAASKLQDMLVLYAQEYNYPDGVNFAIGGESEDNADLIQALLSAFIVALLFIFGILVLQFNSYMQPIIIMFSILMGLFGATLGLKLTGETYSLMFMIGFIALTGIVVNDAIVFLDRANQNKKRGMNEFDAIIETGKARLHPILLTTITTILGLSSILSDSMRKPLAVTIMFGIFFGSAMTLFVLPAIYYDRRKFMQIIKRTILNQLLVGLIYLGIVLVVLSILYFFGVELGGTTRLLPALGIGFVGYQIAYFMYNLRAQTTTGQGFVWKLLGLKVTDKDGNMMTRKKLVERYLIKKAILFGPIILGGIFYALLFSFAPEIAKKLAGTLIAIGYLAVVARHFYQFRTGESNQTLHDKFTGAYIHEESSGEDE